MGFLIKAVLVFLALNFLFRSILKKIIPPNPLEQHRPTGFKGGEYIDYEEVDKDKD